MSGPRATLRSARDARGAVLILVALALPAIIGVGGFVVDVGNWFAHKRHLQVQADAGVLAGAAKYRAVCDALAISDEAAKYSSVDYKGPIPGPGYNPQIGKTPAAELHRMMNSPTFFNQPKPVDNTVSPACNPARPMVDVKLTETDLPWYLKIAQVPFINAHARVEIRAKTTGVGTLPVGVPEVGPRKARAIFVDESNGAVIASTELVRSGTSGGLATWSNTGTPVPVTVDRANIGVRIVLSGSNSTQCGQPLVECYGAGTSTAIVANKPGLAHIRGWSSTPAGSATSPKVRGAELFGVGCEDGYFTATATYPCTVNVGAVVNFGGAIPPTARVLAKKTGARDTTAVELTPPAVAGGQWIGGPLSIPATPSTTSVDLLWKTGCVTDRTKPCGNAGVTASLGTVQRTFVGTEDLAVSGPIKLLRVSENAIPGANSFERCATCTYNLVVTIGLKPGLENAKPGDPPVSLKVAGGGSQNQALDCDPAQSTLRGQLASGCGPAYAVNDGQACLTKNPLWASPQPWKCVVISTGGKVGQIGPGLDDRILGPAGTCTAANKNNWGLYPDLPPGDPRVVELFLTPFGAFTSSGGTTVPVTGFATFYVTGWDNGGCQGQGDDTAGQGAIVGHFIKYIDTLNKGGGGEEFCDFNSLGSCVAVFTR